MENNGQPKDEIMTLHDLARYLKVHPSTLYRKLKRGELPYFRMGSDFRFSRLKIDAWVAGQHVE